jgi:hypothetical protein
MDFKWMAIAIIGVVFAMALSSFSSSQKTDPTVEIEAIKAGLEQCRMNNLPRAKVIWVKDCNEYLKTLEGD